ncbi:MAG TPA: PorP/SprF family type IX secretion system membrane protein [Bacteroidia bacterium]|nr:PorP/SprF family type IX secretion system membrane protein [Bacteroidia bacterium]
MKKLIAFFLFSAFSLAISAQQLPDYTNYPSLLFQLNPAYTGTRSHIDARITYRKQWVGFENAPETQSLGLHSRLWKGKLGAGFNLFQDITGPTKRVNYSFSTAYHIIFPDVELSVGAGMTFNKYFLDGTKMTTHWTGDKAVDSWLLEYDKTKNVTAGVLLYNDRFHFGLGVLNLINNHSDFYENHPDTTKKSVVTFHPHYYFTCGYVFHGHPDYVWENNLMGLYVIGMPITLHYNLRLHYREKFMVGATWRLKDAIAVQAGYTFLNRYQVIYSYDIGISRLHSGHGGTHEFMIGYRMNLGEDKNGYRNHDQFQRQKYNIF